MDVMRTHLTIKAVTKAVCLDSATNTSVVCDRKDILYHVVCLTASLRDVYRVQIHSGGQVNMSPYCRLIVLTGFIKHDGMHYQRY